MIALFRSSARIALLEASAIAPFLNYFKYIAAAATALSFAAAGVVALTVLLFCDSGPVSRCFQIAAAVIGIAILQLVLLIVGWVLLRKGRHIRLSAALLILSVVPLVAGAASFVVAA